MKKSQSDRRVNMGCLLQAGVFPAITNAARKAGGCRRLLTTKRQGRGALYASLLGLLVLLLREAPAEAHHLYNGDDCAGGFPASVFQRPGGSPMEEAPTGLWIGVVIILAPPAEPVPEVAYAGPAEQAADLIPYALLPEDTESPHALHYYLLAATWLMGLGILGWLLHEKRGRGKARKAEAQCEQQFADRHTGRVPRRDPDSEAMPVCERPAVDATAGQSMSTEVMLPTSPEEVVGELERLAAQNGFAPMPAAPNGHRNMAAVTVKGRVRPENQDACVAWRQGDLQIVVTADGVAGCPEGRLAAWLSVRAAARVLARCASGGSLERDPDTCFRAVFRYAANALFEEAFQSDRLGMECLRTTLIAVVCTPTRYLYGYTGDGGIVLRRTDGRLQRLMAPQKDPLRPNVLMASLGPNPQGHPVLGCAERRPGDLLFVGSDGIFDRVDENFFEILSTAAREDGDGDLASIVNEALEQLAAAQDAEGYVCDDNMTLALVATAVPERSLENELDRPTENEAESEMDRRVEEENGEGNWNQGVQDDAHTGSHGQ